METIKMKNTIDENGNIIECEMTEDEIIELNKSVIKEYLEVEQ